MRIALYIYIYDLFCGIITLSHHSHHCHTIILLSCIPSSQGDIDHPTLTEVLKSSIDLRDEVQRKAVMRVKYEVRMRIALCFVMKDEIYDTISSYRAWRATPMWLRKEESSTKISTASL
jgi:hypothetical protein